MWLILEQSGVDVCLKDPGFPVDLTVQGDVAVLIAIYLGHASWQAMVGKQISIEGDSRMAQQLPTWLRLDKRLGRDYRPLARPSA